MTITNYINEGIFLIFQVAFAIDEARMFKKNQTFNHYWWAALNFPILVLLGAASKWDGLLLGTLIIERFVFFSPILNLIRKKPFFYINVTDPNGSVQDKLLGRHLVEVWIFCATLFVFLQFKL